jgi:hypothetical protein
MKFRYTFLVFCLSILLFTGLSHIFIKGKVLAQTNQVVQINVKVTDGNPKGRVPSSLGWKTPWLWDFPFPLIIHGNPDLGITVMDTGSRYLCKSPSSVFKPETIENTLACVFTGVQISGETARIQIIDYDVFEHDTIGLGECKIGQTCQIGQAEVSIAKVPCGDTEIQVNYPSDPEYIQAYDTIYSGYHRYPKEGERIESRICSTSSPGCTRKSVFETMLSEVRFIAPTDLTDQVKNCKITNLDIRDIPTGDDPILTTIDYDTFSITNYTRYDHALHSGLVTRKVIEREGFVFVSTFGEGYGAFPNENISRALKLWQDVDDGLIKAMQKKSSTLQ